MIECVGKVQGWMRILHHKRDVQQEYYWKFTKINGDVEGTHVTALDIYQDQHFPIGGIPLEDERGIRWETLDRLFHRQTEWIVSPGFAGSKPRVWIERDEYAKVLLFWMEKRGLSVAQIERELSYAD